MTNLTKVNIEELNFRNVIRKLAVEFKIKGWSKMTKVQLVEELNKIKAQQIADAKKSTKKTTTKKTTKKSKSDRPSISDDKDVAGGEIITLKEILCTTNINAKTARRKLREREEIVGNLRPYKRWEWSMNKHEQYIYEVYETLNIKLPQ